MYSRDFLCNAVPLHITQGMRFVAALLGLRHIAPQRRARRRIPWKRCAQYRVNLI